MKKMMKTLAAVVCCTMVSMVFTACNKSDDDPTPEKKVKFTYALTVKAATGADDQQEVIKTVLTTPNYTGEMETTEFSEFLEALTKQPGADFTEVPNMCTITIDETLLPDANLSEKEKYSVGLYYKLEVTSMDENGGILDYKGVEADPKMTIKAEKLAQAYPQKTTLTFTVDKDGKIAIRQ